MFLFETVILEIKTIFLVDSKWILGDLKSILSEKLNNNLKEVILFGSGLNNAHRENSDYDILILLHNKVHWKTRREITDICYEVDLKYGILTDIHILSEEELDTPRGKQPIYVRALANGIREWSVIRIV